MKNEEEEKDINTAIMVFAHYIGIDLDSEPDLIWIAEEAFDKLPEGWEFGIGDGEHAGIPFFYNSSTGESDWKHPDEDYYMKKVKKERKLLEEKPRKGSSSHEVEVPPKNKGETSFGGKAGQGKRDQRTKELSDVEIIEDFDDFDHTPQKQVEKSVDEGLKQPQSGGKKKDRPAFGMSEEDFLDGPPETKSKGDRIIAFTDEEPED